MCIDKLVVQMEAFLMSDCSFFALRITQVPWRTAFSRWIRTAFVTLTMSSLCLGKDVENTLSSHFSFFKAYRKSFSKNGIHLLGLDVLGVIWAGWMYCWWREDEPWCIFLAVLAANDEHLSTVMLNCLQSLPVDCLVSTEIMKLLW